MWKTLNVGVSCLFPSRRRGVMSQTEICYFKKEGDIFTDRSNRTYDASQASGSTETHQNPGEAA